MIDNREELYNSLLTITDNVYHCYVEDYKDNKYPKITYRLSNSYDTDYRDGVATTNCTEYTLQVIEKRISGKLEEIHQDVIQLMKDNGYMQLYFDFFRDQEEGINIYTFRFRKVNYY